MHVGNGREAERGYLTYFLLPRGNNRAAGFPAQKCLRLTPPFSPLTYQLRKQRRNPTIFSQEYAEEVLPDDQARVWTEVVSFGFQSVPTHRNFQAPVAVGGWQRRRRRHSFARPYTNISKSILSPGMLLTPTGHDPPGFIDKAKQRWKTRFGAARQCLRNANSSGSRVTISVSFVQVASRGHLGDTRTFSVRGDSHWCSHHRQVVFSEVKQANDASPFPFNFFLLHQRFSDAASVSSP